MMLLFVGVIVCFMWPSRDRIPTVSHGTLEMFPEFKSQFIQKRDVAVWLPEGYHMGDSCDVLYMHDGQMLFDATVTWNHQEWRVDEVMDSLIKAGTIRPCIVVAIWNTRDRLNEYSPDKSWEYIAQIEPMRADVSKLRGDAYLQFIIHELKPFIDDRYKPLTSREHTFIMGSSMGGLISLYALCEYPQVFGGAACLSTHLSMAHLGVDGEALPAAFLYYVDQHLPVANSSLIYMDRGTKDFDAEYGPYQVRLDDAIRSKGWDEQHYVSLVFDGEGHNETCWSKRLNQPLQFLLRK